MDIQDGQDIEKIIEVEQGMTQIIEVAMAKIQDIIKGIED